MQFGISEQVHTGAISGLDQLQAYTIDYRTMSFSVKPE
jgi:hypothetical protein